jgi:hypothetical protein
MYHNRKNEFYNKWVYSDRIKKMYYNLDFSDLEEMKQDVMYIGTRTETATGNGFYLSDYVQDSGSTGTAAWFTDRSRDFKGQPAFIKLQECAIIFKIARAINE